MPSFRATAALATFALLGLAPGALAQRGLTGTRHEAMPFPQPNLHAPGSGIGTPRAAAGAARPIIMLTGYWSPTNKMIRHFSPDVNLNPDGWVGSNWEGRGYDVYSFFPEFPNGLGQGVGNLEVDYQDTSEDFWRIADELEPIAIITFSRGVLDTRWELEWNNRNLDLWIDDYAPPFQPTPTPPDGSVPVNTVRNSTLPIQSIMDALSVMNMANFSTWVDFAGNGGGFLSEYIGYHGVWYQSLHADRNDPAWCITAGHVHVGGLLTVEEATRATNQTMRAVIRHVDEVLDASGGATSWFCPTTFHSAGQGAILTAIGSHSVSQNDLSLRVVHGVPSEFGMAFYGPNTQPAVPIGEGRLCVAAPLHRILPAVVADVDGHSVVQLDMTSAPLGSGPGQVTPGSQWHFQFFLRDNAGGPAGFTASSGLSLDLGP